VQSRSALAALGFALIAVAVLVVLVERRAGRLPEAAGGKGPLVTMFRPVLVAYDETGAKVLEIVCRMATIGRDGRTYTIERLERATLFRGGEPAMVLRADSGTYNENTRNATLQGSVKALSADGFLLETDLVSWVYRDRTVLAPGVLLLKFGELKVQTESASYSVPEQRLDCPKAIEASTVSDRIRGDRLWVEGKERKAVLQGNVRLSSGEGLGMDCAELWYDYGMRRGLVPGQVALTYRGVRGTSRNVEYLVADSILRCPQEVVATLGPDRLRADSLIVDGVRRRAAFNGHIGIVFQPEGAQARVESVRSAGGRRR